MEAKDILGRLVEKGWTLSAMESLTGGLFAASFTAIPGASQAFKGSLVTYCDEAKEQFGVKKETISAHGAISAECAEEMCLSAASLFQSDVSIAFTGNAGPSASEGKPVGLVYVAILVQDKISCYRLDLQGDRKEIRRRLIDFAFHALDEKLAEIA